MADLEIFNSLTGLEKRASLRLYCLVTCQFQTQFCVVSLDRNRKCSVEVDQDNQTK